MTSQVCPTCRQPNALERDTCAACGAALRPAPLVVSSPSALSLSQPLPPEQVKRIVATLAISLAAVLAEAGLRYLQGRLDSMPPPTLRRRRDRTATAIVPAPAAEPEGARENGRVITVISERIIEEKRWGRPVRRVVERFAWRAEEKRI